MAVSSKDLIVKMMLNSTEFDKGISNAKKKVNGFGSGTQAASATVKKAFGAITKAAGALGIALGAKDLFKGFINSTQVMGDQFNNAIESAKTTWKNFTFALATGDGLSALGDYIEAARKLAKAMDDLGTSKIYNKPMQQMYITKAQEEMAKASDKTLSDSERQSHYDKAREYASKATAKSMQDAAYNLNAFAATLESTGAYNSKDGRELLMKIRNARAADGSGEGYEAAVKAFEDLGRTQLGNNDMANEFEKVLRGIDPSWFAQTLKSRGEIGVGWIDQGNKAFDEWIDSMTMGGRVDKAKSKLMDMGYGSGAVEEMWRQWQQKQLTDATGEQLGKMINDIAADYSIIRSASQVTSKSNNKSETLTRGSVSVSTSVEVDDKRDYAMEDFEARKPEIDLASVPQDKVKKGDLSGSVTKEGRYRPMFGGLYEFNPSGGFDVSKMIDEYDMLEDQMISDTEAMEAFVAGLRETGKAQEDTRMALASTVEAMSAVGSVFQSAASIANGTKFDGLASGLAGVASQAASTISALMALSGAQTLKGITETFANAPTGMKIAMTATALAGILGIVGTVKNSFAGSFSTGGVVGGSSVSGDRLIARVNSGEVIMNREQQKRVMGIMDAFDIINSISIPDIVMPPVSMPEMAHGGGGRVDFRISGRDLVGTLSNYSKISAL